MFTHLVGFAQPTQYLVIQLHDRGDAEKVDPVVERNKIGTVESGAADFVFKPETAGHTAVAHSFNLCEAKRTIKATSVLVGANSKGPHFLARATNASKN